MFDGKVAHDPEELKKYPEVVLQFDYRKNTILEALEKKNISLEDVDAVVGRCGGTGSIASGTYEINDTLVENLRTGKFAKHTAILGGLIANDLAKKYGAKGFIVNSPGTDEFQDVSRVTGLKDVYRISSIHALNQKEIGIRFGKSVGKDYKDLNLIIAHIGGGVSVTAHRKGRMIDSNNIIAGEGPMAPTRSGALPATAVVKMCFSGKYTEKQLMDRINMQGGLIDHLGTNNVIEVHQMIESGDLYAKLVYDTMIYQIGKFMGAMASALHGEVDYIILTGGISNDKYLVEKIKEMNGYLAPIKVMAGEFEMEALAAGALRVLRGEESNKEYTGVEVWQGFDDIIATHKR